MSCDQPSQSNETVGVVTCDVAPVQKGPVSLCVDHFEDIMSHDLTFPSGCLAEGCDVMTHRIQVVNVPSKLDHALATDANVVSRGLG